ncbi:MAG TPA: PP2C family protein-serine/threonine phosphatase [Thermoanaerobaculia bacterium]|nr:PP2C family protein-serine/threonine phosphatase [Thermoanaerobaculia bacterium]
MTATMMETPRRAYGWRSWRQMAAELFCGALVGVAITFFETGGTRQVPELHSIARNALIGTLVTMGSRLLETMLSWAIQQSRIPVVFRATLYAVGGWLGYFMAVGLSGTFGSIDRDDFTTGSYHFAYSTIATGLLAVLIGFVLHHNQKRNDRLRASIERLKEHEFAEKELEIARAMQQRLLPPPEIERDGYRVSARTEAAHIVGGDFYDVIRLGDGAVAVLAADVSGKGIAASLLMASCKAAVPFLAATGTASDVMAALNRTMFEQLERREFVAMIFCRYVPATGELEVVNAGMPDPILIGSSARLLAFTGDRLPLGAMRGTRYDATRLVLQRGERLFMFSDGFPEAVVDDAPIGYDRVEQLVASAAGVDDLIGRLRGTARLQIHDDLTVVMLERLQ